MRVIKGAQEGVCNTCDEMMDSKGSEDEPAFAVKTKKVKPKVKRGNLL